MDTPKLPRREFLQMLAGTFAAASFDWEGIPVGPDLTTPSDAFDAVIIGGGLGGLSCGAAFARQGFRPLIIEQHDRPGGYATAFSRPGGFQFDVSLHSTTVGQRDGKYTVIPGFPELTEVEFLPHPTLFRSIYPGHDITVAQRDPNAFMEKLAGLFPAEREGLAGLFGDMEGLTRDVDRLSAARGQVDMSRFPTDFPFLSRLHTKTWGEMMDGRLRDPGLKAIISGQWGYYGLPPSKLSCFYYALPFMGYLAHGGFYPRGRSQAISNAFAKYIKEHGGTILTNSNVERILLNENTAVGVRIAGGKEFKGKVVVSNADPFSTFQRMIGPHPALTEYQSRWQQYSVSLSCFQVFLGLKQDLVSTLGITDSEIFIEPSYDLETSYRHALEGDAENGSIAVTLYDNIYEGYSPPGKNTVNILALQGYSPWEAYRDDYFKGNKTAYKKEKERMAEVLIRRIEKVLMPGLASAIEVREVGTPLTNIRYTSHHRGAIYGWDQTVNNSGQARVGHGTPVKNLYLTGAWSSPGHGYGAVIPGGLGCFAEIMKHW